MSEIISEVFGGQGSGSGGAILQWDPVLEPNKVVSGKRGGGTYVIVNNSTITNIDNVPAGTTKNTIIYFNEDIEKWEICSASDSQQVYKGTFATPAILESTYPAANQNIGSTADVLSTGTKWFVNTSNAWVDSGGSGDLSSLKIANFLSEFNTPTAKSAAAQNIDVYQKADTDALLDALLDTKITKISNPVANQIPLMDANGSLFKSDKLLSDFEPVITTKNSAFNKNYGTDVSKLKQNGVAAVGTEDSLARLDHIHPTDTTREALTNKVSSFTATPNNTNYITEKLAKDSLDLKVDKVFGKQLSTEDYTTAEKTKLAGIEDGAEVNENADWNATTGDAQILNKPTDIFQYNTHNTDILTEGANNKFVTLAGKTALATMAGASSNGFAKFINGVPTMQTSITNSDVASEIDSAKIGDGSISLQEFYTLNGINTTKTIEARFTELSAKNQKVLYVDGTTGLNTNSGLSPLTAVKTLTQASALADGSGILIEQFPTQLTDSVTFTQANLQVAGKTHRSNSGTTGTITANPSSGSQTYEKLSIGTFVKSGPNYVIIRDVTVTTALNNTGAGSLDVINSDFSVTLLTFTGTGISRFYNCRGGTPRVSNTSAFVYIVNNQSVTNPILTAGTLALENCIVYVTQGATLTLGTAGSTISLNNVRFIYPDNTEATINIPTGVIYSFAGNNLYKSTSTINGTDISSLSSNYIQNVKINTLNLPNATALQRLETDANKNVVSVAKNTADNKHYETNTANIKINGVVSVGVLDTIARADHIHPTDTTREALTNKVSSFTATPNNTNYITEKLAKDSLDLKVDKVFGKQLSTEDYTTAEKTKLAGIQAGAEVNVQANWNETNSTLDSFILNKPTLGTVASKNVGSAIGNIQENGAVLLSSQTVETDVNGKFITIVKNDAYNQTFGIGTNNVARGDASYLKANTYNKTEIDTQLSNKLDTSLKGVANGLAELGSDGKVPSSQLPAYVDDVIEVANFASLPAIGETGKIYVTIDTNLQYRWSGTQYVEISPSLALGETSSTAYRGDRGKIAYDHSQTTGNPHGTTKGDVGLGNVDNTADINKNVLSATKLTTARNINGVAFDGTQNITIQDDTKEPIFTKNTAFNKNFGNAIDTVTQGNDARLGTKNIDETNIANNRIQVYNTTTGKLEYQDLPIGSTNLAIANKTATTLDITSDTGADATIPSATITEAGLMTSADKVKLNGIATGATANSTDAELRDRATHTGPQAISTITGLQTALNDKQNAIGSNLLRPTSTNPQIIINTDNIEQAINKLAGNAQFFSVQSQAEMLALTNARVGDYAVRKELTPIEIYTLNTTPASVLANWRLVGGSGSASTNLENSTIQGTFTPNNAAIITNDNGKVIAQKTQGQLNVKVDVSASQSFTNAQKKQGSYNINGIPSFTQTEINALTWSSGNFVFNTTAKVPQEYQNGVWISYGGFDSLRVGMAMQWLVEATIPNDCLLLNGQQVLASEYSELAAVFPSWVIGSNIKLPDFRGYFLRGYGTNTNGTTSGAFLTAQGFATALPTTPFITDNPGDHTHTEVKGNALDDSISSASGSFDEYDDINTNTGPAGAHTHTIISGGDSETRPKNIAVHYIIKAKTRVPLQNELLAGNNVTINTQQVGNTFQHTINASGFVSYSELTNYNYISNGNFSSRQQANTLTHTGTGNQLSCADRFFVGRADGLQNDIISTRQFANNTSVLKIQRVSGTSSVSKIAVAQGYDSETVQEGFAGRTKVFSFSAFHGVNYSGTNGVTCRVYGSITANDLTGRAATGFSTNALDANFTVPSIQSGIANIQRYNFLVAIPSNIQSLMISFEYTPVGTAGADDSFFIANLKSEISTVATPFIYVPSHIVLDDVLPYYERIKGGTSGANIRMGGAFSDSTTVARATLFYRKTKRRTPTLVVSDNAAINLLRFGTDQISTNIAFANTDLDTSRIDVTATGLTGGESLLMNFVSITKFIDVLADNLVLNV